MGKLIKFSKWIFRNTSGFELFVGIILVYLFIFLISLIFGQVAIKIFFIFLLGSIVLAFFSWVFWMIYEFISEKWKTFNKELQAEEDEIIARLNGEKYFRRQKRNL